MSRKRKKPKTVSLAPIGRGGNVQIHMTEVQDPYEKDKKLTVAKNALTTPFDAEFHIRKSITEDQFEAGNRFLALYERIEIGGAKAIRYDIPKVDVSHSHKDVTIGSAEAQERLDGIRSYIGRKSYELLVSVVGNRVSIDSMTADQPSKWLRDQMSFHFRKCLRETLQELADHLGIAAKGRGRGLRVERMEDAA